VSSVAPVCSNCGASEFVWVNELRTGTIGGGSLSIRSRGELSLGTRLCRNCGHADLFLKDPAILRMPHTWRPGEFVPIPSKPAAAPAPVASPATPPVPSTPAATPPSPPAPARPLPPPAAPAPAPPVAQSPAPPPSAPPMPTAPAEDSAKPAESPTPADAPPADAPPAAKSPRRRSSKPKGSA